MCKYVKKSIQSYLFHEEHCLTTCLKQSLTCNIIAIKQSFTLLPNNRSKASRQEFMTITSWNAVFYLSLSFLQHQTGISIVLPGKDKYVFSDRRQGKHAITTFDLYLWPWPWI